MPNVGCMIGTAYQTLAARLGEILDKSGLDITVPEYMVLRALYTRDGMQQCEIGEMIGKDKAAICRTVKAMEKKNLIRTEPISHKCLKVYIADRGHEIKSEIFRIAEERHQALATLVTPDELAVFDKVLRKIIQPYN